MGWQDRDYARLGDNELADIYGLRRTVSTRAVVWPVVGIAVCAIGIFAWSQRGSVPATAGPGITPSALYGFAIPAGSSLGPPGVCQELEYDVDVGWRCDELTVNTANVPVVRPSVYNGPCAHLKVDGVAWVCLTPTVTPPPVEAPVGANA